MNSKIKELAEQAGFEYSSQWTYWTAYEQDLERFSELVRKDEREACLIVLETYPTVLEMIKAIRGRTE